SSPQTLSQINGRPVLQPHSNIVPLFERRNSLKKTSNVAPPVAANESPRLPAIKRGNSIDPNGLSSSAEKVVTPKGTANKTPTLLKKPKSSGATSHPSSSVWEHSSSKKGTSCNRASAEENENCPLWKNKIRQTHSILHTMMKNGSSRVHDDKDAFSGFDPEIVSKYNEKKITSTSVEYGIELSQVRGAVDNP
ncbi:hypothetical protein HAX54_017591, partial [Datura stramonium]|nr:hypothetical protein [Datura stramonium]